MNLRRRLSARILSVVVVLTLVMPPGLVVEASGVDLPHSASTPQSASSLWVAVVERLTQLWKSMSSLSLQSDVPTPTAPLTATPSVTLTLTPTITMTPTVTVTPTATVTPTLAVTATPIATEAVDVPFAATPTLTVTPTLALTPTSVPTVAVPVTSTFDAALTPTPDLSADAPVEVAPDLPAMLSVPLTMTATLSDRGGRLAMQGGRVTIDVPDGAISDTTPVRLTLSRPTTPRPGAVNPLWLALEVVAVDALQDTEHLRFARPVTLTLDLTGFPAWLSPYLVHETDAKQGVWEIIPSHYDDETRLLTAQVDSFCEVGVDGAMKFPNDGTHYLMTSLAAVSDFTGAATYDYPLAIPPGRNGMAPSFSLVYSSGALNGVMGTVQSNYVGSGWSVGGLIEIVRPIKTHTEGGDSGTEIMWQYESDFRLVMGGASYRLRGPEHSTANDNGCRYYADDAPQLKIMRYTYAGSNHQLCGYTGSDGASTDSGQKSKEYWMVTTADGTVYRLGFSADSEQLTLMQNYTASTCSDLTTCNWSYWYAFHGYAGQGTHLVPYRWSVDRVVDIHGNMMVYKYHEEPRYDSSTGVSFDRAQYPDYVRYTGVSTSPTSGYNLVQFVREARTLINDNTGQGDAHDDGNASKRWTMYDSKRIDRIRACVSPTEGATSCPSTNIYAEYDLDYQFIEEQYPGTEWIVGDGHETTRLTQIIRSGWDSAQVKRSLPAVTFAYTAYNQADNTADPLGGIYGDKLVYPRLTSMGNGYGGQVSFSYNTGAPYNCGHVYSYAVTQRSVSAGLGSANSFNYAYTEPCFSYYDGHIVPNCGDPGEEPTYALIGHKSRTLTVINYDGIELSRETQYFHTAKSVLRGKPIQTLTYEGSALLAQTDTVWTVRAVGPGSLGATMAQAAQTLSSDFTQSPVFRARTDMSYDWYGNPTASLGFEYTDGTAVTVANSGFESALGSWSSFWSPSPASATQDTAHSGSYSLKLQSTSVSGGVYQDFLGKVVVNKTYIVRAWVKATHDATSQFQIWLTDASTTGANPHRSKWMNPGTNWQLVEMYYVASSTNLRVHLFFSPGAGSIYVDDIQIVRADAIRNTQSEHSDSFNLTGTPWLTGLQYQTAVFGKLWAGDEIDIVFANDGGTSGDRNLYVDYIQVDGKTIQAEDARVTLDRGKDHSGAFDWRDIMPGQQGVYWNGALRLRTIGPYSATPSITVRAKGTPGDGVYPIMTVYFNGTPVLDLTVTSTWTNYSAGISPNLPSEETTRSFTYYDDTSHNVNNWGVSTQINKGMVTMTGAGSLSANQAFATTWYGYDPWGNVTSVTDPRGYATTTTYDSVYHTFAIQSCTPPLAPVGVLCSTVNYYGVNPSGLTGSYGLFGQVDRTYDANGTATAVIQVYDAFGRVIKIVKPGDSITVPTASYAYADPYNYNGLHGFRLTESLREISGAGGNLPTFYFYDGLGRLVQVRRELTDGATQSVVNTTYNALDQPVHQYAAAEETYTVDFSRPSGWDSRPRTITVVSIYGRECTTHLRPYCTIS